jgi:hypothetical protein
LKGKGKPEGKGKGKGKGKGEKSTASGWPLAVLSTWPSTAALTRGTGPHSGINLRSGSVGMTRLSATASGSVSIWLELKAPCQRLSG